MQPLGYKTILLHVADGPEGARLAGAAASVARMFEATVVGVGAVPWQAYIEPVVSDPGPAVLDRVGADATARIAAAEQRFLEATEGLPRLWFSETVHPDEAVVKFACTADLLVAPRPRGWTDIRYAVKPGDLLMSAGLPVLTVPPDATRLRGETVLVCWKRKPEAERAISAALPMLRRAEDVAIVSAPEGGQEADGGELSFVLGRLRRHGVKARLLDARPHGEAGPALIDAAESIQADLIVCGAYGRPRVVEWVLGGVTQHLLEHASQFVLFSG